MTVGSRAAPRLQNLRGTPPDIRQARPSVDSSRSLARSCFRPDMHSREGGGKQLDPLGPQRCTSVGQLPTRCGAVNCRTIAQGCPAPWPRSRRSLRATAGARLSGTRRHHARGAARLSRSGPLYPRGHPAVAPEPSMTKDVLTEPDRVGPQAPQQSALGAPGRPTLAGGTKRDNRRMSRRSSARQRSSRRPADVVEIAGPQVRRGQLDQRAGWCAPPEGGRSRVHIRHPGLRALELPV